MNSKTQNKDKVLIYLADLVHNYTGKGPFMFPINIGYLATFTKAYMDPSISERLAFKLFKYPEPLLEELERNPPNFLGLSNYTWNADLDDKVLQFAKSKSNKTVTVIGGPNIHEYQEALDKFFEKRPFLDFYVINQGESGFLNLLSAYFSLGQGLDSMKESSIPGVVHYDKKKGVAVRGQDSPRIKNLDTIPSPYLEGILDEFFEDKLIPNIETNRGCPYACTFCDWGSAAQQKISSFGLERLKEEFEYIGRKVKNTNMLCISDANFGIFEDRDYDISKMIKSVNERTGYPRKTIQAWAKNKSLKIIRIAEMLGDLTSVTAAFQSLDPIVLKAIKRDNISTEAYKEIIDHFNEKNIESHAELILGLSAQTKESHLEDLRTVSNLDVGQIWSYNCRMLEGAEMDLPGERKKYDVKTKYRLVDQGFGKYKDFLSFETEEMVRSTNTMSEEDVFFFRPLHWLVYYTWNYKYHRGLLKHAHSFGVNPIDFLVSVLDNIQGAPKGVQTLMQEFERESRSEWFDSVDALVKHYSQPEVFEEISNGGFGKLNFKYIFKTLIECPNEFDQYMKDTAKRLLSGKGVKQEDHYKAIDEIIHFEDLLRINFSGIDLDKKFSITEERYGEFKHDILSWRKDHYKRSLEDYKTEHPVRYLFYIPNEQVVAINNNINQFKNKNLNLTLRKMSEYMRISDLFYKVRPLDGREYTNKIEDMSVQIGQKVDG